MTKHTIPHARRLVKRARLGDAAAFEELVRPCRDTLYRVAASALGVREADAGDVADALQTTLIAAWRGIGEVREPRYFKTWLVRICINQCRQIQRQRKPSVPLEALSEERLDAQLRSAGARDDAAQAREAAEADEKFARLVALAGEANALAMTLYYGEGYSTTEIAELLELTPEGVRQRLFRGRKRIARALGADEEAGEEAEEAPALPSRRRAGRPRAPTADDELIRAARPA